VDTVKIEEVAARLVILRKSLESIGHELELLLHDVTETLDEHRKS